jgi:hypothetical protein
VFLSSRRIFRWRSYAAQLFFAADSTDSLYPSGLLRFLPAARNLAVGGTPIVHPGLLSLSAYHLLMRCEYPTSLFQLEFEFARPGLVRGCVA